VGSAGAGARGAGGIYDAVCLRLGDEVRTALLLLRRLSLLTVFVRSCGCCSWACSLTTHSWLA